MKITFNDLLNMGLIKQSCIKNKTTILINNPYWTSHNYNKERQYEDDEQDFKSRFLIIDRSDKDLSKLKDKSKYIFKDYGTRYSQPIIKKFDSYEEFEEFLICKSIYRYITQRINGRANDKYVFSKDKFNKIKEFDCKTIKKWCNLIRIYKNPEKITNLFLKDLKVIK